MERRRFLSELRGARRRAAGARRAAGRVGRRAPQRSTRAHASSTSTASRSGRAQLAAETNYVFHYPYAGDAVLPAEACAHAVTRRGDAAARGRHDLRVAGRRRAASAASSRSRRSARTSSRTRRATSRSSATSASRRRRRTRSVIHCCADHSVYDPADGARVLSRAGAAAARGDPARVRRGDGRAPAIGTVGAEQFDAFFRQVRFQARAWNTATGKAKRARWRDAPSCASCRSTAGRRSSADRSGIASRGASRYVTGNRSFVRRRRSAPDRETRA